MSRSTSTSVLRRAAGVVACWLTASVALAPAATAVPDDSLPKVGRIQLNTLGVPVLTGIDETLNLLVAPLPSESSLFLIDTVRYGRVSKVTVPFRMGGAVSLDSVRHRLFVPHDASSGADPTAAEPPKVSLLSLPRGTALSTFTFPDEYRGQAVDATYYDAKRNRLYVVTDVPGQLIRLFIHELDVSSNEPRIVWSYDLSACGNVPDGGGRFGALGRSARGEFLYLLCAGNVSSPSNGVVRLDLIPGSSPADTSRFVPDFHYFSGGLGDGFASVDPAHDRVLIFATAAGSEKMYVFDAYLRAWVGSVPLGNVGLGGAVVDPVSSRIFVSQNPGGLLVTEGAAVPTPQGRTYPTDLGLRGGQPVFDSRSRRLFVPAGRFTKDGGLINDVVLVYQDRLPLFNPPSDDDPDARTQNVAEVPGRTDSAFSAGGSAYGARYVFTGGLQNKFDATVYNAIEAMTNLYAGAFTTAGGESQNAPFKPGGAARSLLFGRVTNVFVDNGTATAKSIASDADPTTMSDIAQLRDTFRNTDESDPVAPAKAPARDAIRWPYTQAACVDFGGEDDSQEGREAGASTGCEASRSRAEAEARSTPELGSSPIQVGYSWSKISVTREPGRGIVARADAIARNVDVAGVLSIGEVITRSEAVAFGRPGTAKSTYSRELREVVVRNQDGSEAYRCGFGDDACDPLEMMRAANRTLAPRVRVDAPERETNPGVAQTKGGAQSLVAKSEHRYWSDFNNFSESSFEVAGLVVSLYDDAYPQVLQLAGVAVDAHYTVSAFGQGSGPGDVVSPPLDVPPAPAGPGTIPVGPTNAPGSDAQPVIRIIERGFTGIAFALKRPREAFFLAAFWSLAGVPLYLASRRRRLAGFMDGGSL